MDQRAQGILLIVLSAIAAHVWHSSGPILTTSTT
jgi:hypothetical protein